MVIRTREKLTKTNWTHWTLTKNKVKTFSLEKPPSSRREEW